MKIGIIGATGKAGQCIFRELTARGHQVTAIIRDVSKVATPGLNVIVKDAFHLCAQDLRPFDVVVNAFGTPPHEGTQHLILGHHLMDVFRELPETRLIIIGSAGSLFLDRTKTRRIAESPKLPIPLRETFQAQTLNLIDFENTKINWTYISPALFFDAAGAQTNTYQIGTSEVIFNSKGYSYISYYDFAIAVADEIEQTNYPQQHMTVVAEVGKPSWLTSFTNRSLKRILK